jgi:hypothetical protein
MYFSNNIDYYNNNINYYNNIAKFVSKPVGKKFSTIMIMKDGTEIVMKKAGGYKPYANVCFYKEKIENGHYAGTYLGDITYNNKPVYNSWTASKGNGCTDQKLTHLVFNIELI